jgi:predicted HD phosphohydrolase
MRNWDEAAKEENMKLPEFKDFKSLMEECVI